MGAVALAARGGERDTARAMSQENVDAVRSMLDGWNRGDVDSWLASAHPEIEWSSEIARRMQGAETMYLGRAAMRRFWDEWHSVWDLTIEASEIRDLGDTVLVVGRMRARGKASGVDLDEAVAYVYELDGGLIRKARAYLDPSQALEALGLRE
jgi:ketosteroid isomerase-like protein